MLNALSFCIDTEEYGRSNPIETKAVVTTYIVI